MEIFFSIFVLLFVIILFIQIFLSTSLHLNFLQMLSTALVSSATIAFFAAFFITFLIPIILFFVLIGFVSRLLRPKSESRGGPKFYYYSSGNFHNQYNRSGQNGYSNPFTNGLNSRAKNLETLGLTSTASQDEIKQRYRELARRHHPDRHSMADEKTREFHNKKFKEINQAYDILKK